VNPRQLPPQIKKSKWRALYTEFIKSPHFDPWFKHRRRLSIYQFTQTLRTLRESVTAEMLLMSPFGGQLPLRQCETLEQEIMATLKAEKEHHTVGETLGELDQIHIIETHLAAVRKRIQELLGSSK
jgi:hypothetical protein